MTKTGPYETETKAIKLLQDRAARIGAAHAELGSDLAELKARLAALQAAAPPDPVALAEAKAVHLAEMSRETTLTVTSVDAVYAEARATYRAEVSLQDILTVEDFETAFGKIDARIADFNRRYALDAWDYAIAGSCGLFAAMLDLLFVKAPPKPTTPWKAKVDGVFNQWVQQAFNAALPPDISDMLGKLNKIGSADASTIFQLIDAPPKTLSPTNHRLRSLSHDPVLGFLFGVWDMMNGTCTVVQDGRIVSYPGKQGPTQGTIFDLLGRMLGHLMSDVNAPSANGNRGMGLPAPFMGILRMFDGIPVGDSTFGRQIEFMYTRGYDFRQFVVTSIPMTIMEVMLRGFYVVKQMKTYDAPFGQTMLDTMPATMNPRFRMMLALAYGTSSAVNAGKMYVTRNILNASYASWMGLAWNGFHALRWALVERHLTLWDGIEVAEIAELQALCESLDGMAARAATLPTG